MGADDGVETDIPTGYRSNTRVLEGDYAGSEAFKRQWDIHVESDLPDNADTRRRSDARRCVGIMVQELVNPSDREVPPPKTPAEYQAFYQRIKQEMIDEGRLLGDDFNEKDLTRALIGELGWSHVAKRHHGDSLLDGRIGLYHTLITAFGEVTSPIIDVKSTPKLSATPLVTDAKIDV